MQQQHQRPLQRPTQVTCRAVHSFASGHGGCPPWSIEQQHVSSSLCPRPAADCVTHPSPPASAPVWRAWPRREHQRHHLDLEVCGRGSGCCRCAKHPHALRTK